MITSAEVGSVFMIQDRASAVMAEMAENASRLADMFKTASDSLIVLGDAAPLAGMAEQLAAMTANLAALNTAAIDANASLSELGSMAAVGGSEMADSFKMAAVEVDGVKASVASLADQLAALGLGGAAAAGGAGRAAGGGLLGKLFSLPAMIAEYFGYESIKMSGEEDMSARIALENMGLPSTDENLNRYKQISSNAAMGTRFNEAKTAEMLSQMSGVLGFTGEGAMDKFGQIAPLALYMGELAKNQGLGNPEEAAVAGIQFAHMTGRYDPASLGKGLDELFNISQLTHTTPAQQLTIQKYAIPMARSLGMDPDEAMKLTGFFEQMGLKGSTAGTGFGQMMMGLLSIGGPLAAQQSSTSGAQLEHILGLKGGTFGKGNMHTEALKELGLTNVFDDKGKIQSDVLMTDLIDASKKFNPHDFAQLLQKAFTVRGARNAAMLDDPEITSRMERFAEALRSLAPISQRQADQAQSSIQIYGQLFARIGDLAITLGNLINVPLSRFAALLAGAVTGLDNMLKWMTGHQSLSASMEASGSAMSRAAKFAAAGTLLDPAVQAQQEASTAARKKQDWETVKGWFGFGSKHSDDMSPVNAALMMRSGGFDASKAMRAASPLGLTIHGGVNLYGAPSDSPDKFADRFLYAINKKIGSSQLSNLGGGDGTYFSPFTTGTGP